MRRLALLAPLFALSLSAVACGSENDGTSSVPSGGEDETAAGGSLGGPIVIGPDGVPVGPDGKPIPPVLDGTYEMSNVFDLTSAGVFPDVANDTLKALSEFRESPSKTMVDLLDAAKAPVVSQVIGVIPGALKDQVYGWMDDAIFDRVYNGVPATKTLAGMLDDLASIATQFELVSTLDLPKGDAIGNSKAKHTVSGVAYNWSSNRHVINAPDVLKNVEAQSVAANAVALAELTSQLEAGRLTLGEHDVTLPVGSFAILGADAMAKDLFGANDLRGALGKVVDCDAVGKSVSDKCVGVSAAKVCVGHQKEIASLCSAGLDAIVAATHAGLKTLDIPLAVFRNGEAKMWDAPSPGAPLDAKVDRIDSGYWTATINDGHNNQRIVLATFTGKRIGDSGTSGITTH